MNLPNGRTRAIMPLGKLWMNGSTLRVRFLGGTAAQQAKAKEQALWWTEFANLHFDFGNAVDAEIRISFDPNDGAWSYIGTDNRGIPSNQATMNLGFMDGGAAGHEFGHAIGLAHEHQNPDGGIEWNEALVSDATELKVNARKRTAALIGKPGEEDLYKFTVTTGGNHIIDTAGPTDVVIKLFGPDSQTQVIDEDDDSGTGTNARIVASLMPGLYYVQVRHYNSTGGTGNYTVKVRRTA